MFYVGKCVWIRKCSDRIYMSKFEQIIPSCDYWWDFVEARKVLFYLKVVTK